MPLPHFQEGQPAEALQEQVVATMLDSSSTAVAEISKHQQETEELRKTKQVVATLQAVEPSAIQQLARRTKEVAALQKDIEAAEAGKARAVKVSFCCFC